MKEYKYKKYSDIKRQLKDIAAKYKQGREIVNTAIDSIQCLHGVIINHEDDSRVKREWRLSVQKQKKYSYINVAERKAGGHVERINHSELGSIIEKIIEIEKTLPGIDIPTIPTKIRDYMEE